MYSRLTPRGRSVGILGAKALVVIAIIAGITCVVRSFRSALSSPERASGYNTASRATPLPSPVVVREPSVPPVIAQVDNVAKPVPRPPIRQPRMILPVGRITFVPLLKNSTASSPRWEESSSSSPGFPPSDSRSDDADRRRYEDHYVRHDAYRPPPPRITYKRFYGGTSYAGRSSSPGRESTSSRDGERRSRR